MWSTGCAPERTPCLVRALRAGVSKSSLFKCCLILSVSHFWGEVLLNLFPPLTSIPSHFGHIPSHFSHIPSHIDHIPSNIDHIPSFCSISRPILNPILTTSRPVLTMSSFRLLRQALRDFVRNFVCTKLHKDGGKHCAHKVVHKVFSAKITLCNFVRVLTRCRGTLCNFVRELYLMEFLLDEIQYIYMRVCVCVYITPPSD